MDKKQSKSNVAKLVKTEQPNRRLYGELRTRPMSLAFLIREDIQKDHFIDILEYLSTIWGGYYCCLIPTNGEEITETWWEILCTYNPDKIIICGDTPSEQELICEDLLKRINRELQPYSFVYLNKWDSLSKNLEHQKGYGNDIFDSISLINVLNFEMKKLNYNGKKLETNISIPLIDENDSNYLNVIAQVGIARDFYKSAYKDIFGSEEIPFSSENNLKEYLEILGKFYNKISPLDVTRFTTKVHSKSPGGMSRVV